MPKRKRDVLDDRGDQSPPLRPQYTSLPLTRANLRAFTAAMSSGRASPPKRTPSPSKASSRSTSPTKFSAAGGTTLLAKAQQRLKCYNIIEPQGNGFQGMPDRVRALVDKIRTEPRQPAVDVSPNGKFVATTQPRAMAKLEAQGTHMLADELFWAAAYQRNGEPLVEKAESKAWSRFYHPNPATDIRPAGELEQARPDITFGYIYQDMAKELEAPFDEADEALFRQYAVCDGLCFPYFTVEMKSASAGGTIPEAIVQGARSGAIALKAMEFYFTTAYGLDRQSEYKQELCHFSATSDLQTAHIYVHWLEAGGAHHDTSAPMPRYRMERIKQIFLDEQYAVEDYRRMLRHILDFARGPRLDSIKAAAPAFRIGVKQGLADGTLITPPVSIEEAASERSATQMRTAMSTVSLGDRATPALMPSGQTEQGLGFKASLIKRRRVDNEP